MNTVAIQGVKGSYSEDAALKIFGGSAQTVECLSFEETFATLAAKTAQFAVVPVANTIVGEIVAVATLLDQSGFKVREQLALQIQHILAGTRDAEMEKLVSVRSHAEALKQCKRFLDSLPTLSRLIGADTASSIRRIVEEGDPANAAIGSRRAAEIYGAKIIRENIADAPDNWTTFYLIEN